MRRRHEPVLRPAAVNIVPGGRGAPQPVPGRRHRGRLGRAGHPGPERLEHRRLRDGTGFLPLGYYPQTGSAPRRPSTTCTRSWAPGPTSGADRTRALRITFGDGRGAPPGSRARRRWTETTDSRPPRGDRVLPGRSTPRGCSCCPGRAGRRVARARHRRGAVTPRRRPQPVATTRKGWCCGRRRSRSRRGRHRLGHDDHGRTDPADAVPRRSGPRAADDLAMHSERLGYQIPAQTITMTPNVTRPRSRGRVGSAPPTRTSPADRLRLVHRRRRSRRADAAGRHEDGAPRRRAEPDGPLGGARGLPRSRCHH